MCARRSTRVADAVAAVLGPDLPIAVETYDGGRIGPDDPPATLLIRSPDAIRRIVSAPGELGVGRAYVAGELDVEGDVYAALSSMRERLPSARIGPRALAGMARIVGTEGLRPLPLPPEEARLHGRRHSRRRDAQAIAHHYDVSNRFYGLVLGPSMTYSCGVWASPEISLEEAQAAKYELTCRKLGLREGMRLLDVGCGWGGMAMHAARHHGVRAVGVTLSRAQEEWAQKAVAEEGLADRVAIRLQDYRDVRDGPFDAISSIGMFEHVGLRNLGLYFRRAYRLLRPEGRMLNHGISRPAARRRRSGRRPPATRARLRRNSFVDRYVFPDGELHEVGAVVSTMQAAGFEVRHVESLREHYALTLRAWVRNLEDGWDEAVAEVGAPRARIWRLYMAASALNFEVGRTQVHQVLAVRSPRGRSGMPLRPDW
ncbi:MAG TPA: cyclopropane-fatty-acyl-phospholipid synthase family protein [Actinomycetota bacterium]|nr:cyclopropane-fatty-acyl-phospholipid synthase family protein [Actinomycetota bacterium]